MGFHITDMQLNVLFQTWQTNYHIYAPRNFSGGGRFSDTDCIRYGKIEHADEIVFDKKSDYSFKEVLTPVSQTLFFFTEGQTKEADFPQKGAVIFLRSCDLYALKRLDDMYLRNGNLARKVFAPGSFQIFLMLHGKNGYFMAFLFQQLF